VSILLADIREAENFDELLMAVYRIAAMSGVQWDRVGKAINDRWHELLTQGLRSPWEEPVLGGSDEPGRHQER